MPADLTLLEGKLEAVGFDRRQYQTLHGVELAIIGASSTGRIDYDSERALQGFEQMRVRTHVHREGLTRPLLSRSVMLVDGVHQVNGGLRAAGRSVPAWNDYPPELEAFYGRKLETTTWRELNKRDGEYFIKRPGKGAFQPCVIRFPWKPTGVDNDYNVLHLDDDDVLLASEPVEFVAEWRAFCVDGEVLDVRQYDGSWKYTLDISVVARAAARLHPKVRGYSIDFGLTRQGETLVVETNAGRSLGAYGLRPDLYAMLLAAAWAGAWGDE